MCLTLADDEHFVKEQPMGKMKTMETRLIQKVLFVSLIYLIALPVILVSGYLFGSILCSWVTWRGNEFLYRPLKWVETYPFVLGVCLYLAGELIIILYFWKKTAGYLTEVSRAIAWIPEGGGRLLQLSPDIRELEVELNAVRNQIQTSRLQAKEAEQRKNDLVVYLAHDLKTPLTSVLGYLALLEESPELTLEQRSKYLGIAVQKANRLEELINEFFEITRFNLTSIELERRNISFTRLLEQTVFEFQPMLLPKELTCSLLAEKDYMAFCDLDKIQRVVDNLLRNAILYSDEGSEIILKLYETGNALVLKCENQGITIPPEKLERIFEQFYRLDSARTSTSGGAGLGLAIAKEIVRLHGGNIFAESSAGRTVFTVELPKI